MEEGDERRNTTNRDQNTQTRRNKSRINNSSHVVNFCIRFLVVNRCPGQPKPRMHACRHANHRGSGKENVTQTKQNNNTHTKSLTRSRFHKQAKNPPNGVDRYCIECAFVNRAGTREVPLSVPVWLCARCCRTRAFNYRPLPRHAHSGPPFFGT